MKQSKSPTSKNQTASQPPSQSSSKLRQEVSASKNGTKQSKIPSVKQSNKGHNPKQEDAFILDSISKDNFDVFDGKLNITEIVPLEIKYVLKCISGIYKNRFLYITTHKDGEIIGGGDAK